MKNIFNFCGLKVKTGTSIVTFAFAFLFAGCGKEVADPEKPFFTPTEHIIAFSASKLWFTIEVPHKGVYYNLGADSSMDRCPGGESTCISFFIPLSEMEVLSRFLSDTVFFKWRPLDRSKHVYPADHCELRVNITDQKLGLYLRMMCSIGNDRSTIEILNELAKAVSLEARTAFDTLIHSFEMGPDMNEKYFDPIRIDSLHLDKVDGFWIENASQSVNRSISPEYKAPGFMDAIYIISLGRQIGFYVFLTRDAALKEMEVRSNSTLYTIQPGAPGEMTWPCWYDTIRRDNGIYLNIRNTLLYLDIADCFLLNNTLYCNDSDSLNYFVKEQAIKLAEIIENLSEYKQENE
ncbi:MAG: hypothetical protein U0T82_10940 [Bacteroidales bacterium]